MPDPGSEEALPGTFEAPAMTLRHLAGLLACAAALLVIGLGPTTAQEEADPLGGLGTEFTGEAGGAGAGQDNDLDLGDLGGMEGMEDLMMGGGAGGDGADFDMESIMAQMQGMGGMGGDMMGGGGIAARREAFDELPSEAHYVQCEVCRAAVRRAHFRVSQRREKLTKTQVKEHEIDEMLTNLCNARHEEGVWLTEYDIIETVDEGTGKITKLSLKRMNSPGHCEEDCWTLEEACKRVLREAETDLAEELWRNKLSKDELSAYICDKVTKGLKGSCAKKYPKSKISRPPRGENFRAKNDLNLKIDESLRDSGMFGGGMGMGMPNPDEL